MFCRGRGFEGPLDRPLHRDTRGGTPTVVTEFGAWAVGIVATGGALDVSVLNKGAATSLLANVISAAIRVILALGFSRTLPEGQQQEQTKQAQPPRAPSPETIIESLPAKEGLVFCWCLGGSPKKIAAEDMWGAFAAAGGEGGFVAHSSSRCVVGIGHFMQRMWSRSLVPPLPWQ